MNHRPPVLTIAIVSEVALVVLAYLVAWVSGIEIGWDASPLAVLIGATAAGPLLIGNHVLWRWTLKNPNSVYARFSREVIVPLCKQVTTFHALLIGLLSGIGEEVLFRGTLNLLCIQWFGFFGALIVSSVTFAWVHFIGNTKRYGGMIPLYTGVGAVLWLVWYLTDSLAAAAATHATYNFLAIVWIRRLARREGV